VDALVPLSVVAAGLLTLAGAQKTVDPTMAVGALRALRVPASAATVRAGSLAELALGTGAIVSGGPVLWSLVAVSYLAFAAFVVVALRQGTMIGSCGCFGREETPPHPTHVVLNLLLAAVGVIAAARSITPLEALLDHPGLFAATVPLVTIALVGLHAAFVDLPRALRPASR